MKKVLVTGATGFVGSYVVADLLSRGLSVIATSSDEKKAAAFNWFNEVRYLPFDFNTFDNKVNYFEYFERPDIAIHLAWEGLPNYKDSFHLEKNLPLHQAVLENLVRNGLRNLTVTGTCFEYGMKAGKLSESTPADPANAYAIAKHRLQQFLSELTNRYQCSFKWVRLFYMYGKGQSPKSLISQLDAALANNEPEFNMSGGEQQRDFLPVEEVAAHITKVALQNRVEGIVNICSGVPVTVKDFVVSYLQQQQKEIKLNLGYYPYPDYEPMVFWGDNTKLHSIISNV